MPVTSRNIGVFAPEPLELYALGYVKHGNVPQEDG
jgi:hypothetical protein